MILQEELTMEEVEAPGDSDVVLSQSVEEDLKGIKILLEIDYQNGIDKRYLVSEIMCILCGWWLLI